MAKKSVNHCSFCGRSEKEVPLMLNGIAGFICSDCVETAHQIVSENLKRRKSDSDFDASIPLKRPTEIKAKLDEYVIGQDEAKIALSVAVYNHYKRLQQQALMQDNKDDEVEIEKSNIIINFLGYRFFNSPRKGTFTKNGSVLSLFAVKKCFSFFFHNFVFLFRHCTTHNIRSTQRITG